MIASFVIYITLQDEEMLNARECAYVATVT